MDLQKTLDQMQRERQRKDSLNNISWSKLGEPPTPDNCICGGTGWFRVDTPSIHHPWFGKVFPCRCKVGQVTTAVQDMIGSPFSDITLDDFRANTEVTKLMRRQAAHFTREMIDTYCVWGSNGAGKTTILSAITNEFLKHGIPALYINAYDLMQYVKEGINHIFGTDERIGKVVAVPVLCLDELTQVRMTEYNRETLETILDRRIRVNKPTAVACDQDPEEVLTPRLTSRLKQGAYIHVVGTDWRVKQGEMNMDEADRAAAMERGE